MPRPARSIVRLCFTATFALLAASSCAAETLPLQEIRAAGRSIQPLAPPLGLKTYRDLGIVVDETMMACAGQSKASKKAGALKPLMAGAWVFPLFDDGHQIKLLTGAQLSGTPGETANTLWCSYSKDAGQQWSEPRFVAALVNASTQAAFQKITLRKGTGRTLRITLESGASPACEVWFKEDDLNRLATASDLRQAPAGKLVITSVPANNTNPELLADSICVGGDIAFPPAKPPAGYKVAPELGMLVHESISGQIIHRGQSASGSLFETRAVVTPGGDYLVMIPDGQHANTPRDDANHLVGYRSNDQGQTWTGPFSPFGDNTKHHGGLPLIPRDRKRIYVFETQRGELAKPSKNDKAVGFRFSDDDGRQWSPVELLHLDDGKLFSGIGVIQMTETDARTWMIGFHHGRVLRGALDGGERKWSMVTPVKPVDPEALENRYFLDELRILALQGPAVLGVARTCEGHLWEMRSKDDGRTWGDVRPTSLVQPDAPPMIFPLSDGKTLIALHHNRAVMRSVHEPRHSDWLTMPTPGSAEIALGNEYRHSFKDWVSRAEVWCSLSQDNGQHWSEPRLLFANALAETLDGANPNYQCSYVDLFVDRGMVHLIVPHRWQRVVHLTFPEDKLSAFLTRDELRRSVESASPTAK